MKNILILIAALFLISSCGDSQVKKDIETKGNSDVSHFVNFPDEMNNCKLFKLRYKETDNKRTLFTVVCPHSTTTTSYTSGKQFVNIVSSSGDINNKTLTEQQQVIKLFNEKTSFLDNIVPDSSFCDITTNQKYYSCTSIQRKELNNKITENLISMKCNTTECIL